MVTAGLDAAYASCERLARSHYENFPVASVLLPPRMRRHIAAVYAFARAADDFADEGEQLAAERLRLLDGWNQRLQRAVDGHAQMERQPGEPAETIAIFAALGNTIRQCALPPELLADLISAFTQDVTVHRYHDWAALFDYARRSANPVGRLVLRIGGYRGDDLDTWSDAICTALQFTNFWQDYGVDYARGRVYLPHAGGDREDADGDQGTGATTTKQELFEAIRKTRELFMAGRPLCDALSGRLRYELRATWLGGMRILDCVERQLQEDRRNGQLTPATRMHTRPTLDLRDAPWFAWRMITWASR